MFTYRSAAVRCYRTLSLVLGLTALAAQVFAQWPTSYQAPKVLVAGVERYACALHATTDGGAIVICDSKASNLPAPEIIRFDRQGVIKWQKSLFMPFSEAMSAIRFQISPYKGAIPATGDWLITTELPRTITDEVSWTYMVIGDTGVELQNVAGGYVPKQIVTAPNSDSVFLLNQPTTGHIHCVNMTQNNGDILDLNGLSASSFHAQMVDASTCMFTYTVSADSETRAKRVQIGILASGIGSRPVFNQPYTAQDHGRLTAYTTTSTMVNWISDPDVNPVLYAATSSHSNTELTSPIACLTNVVDYITTDSTIGLPVFAAVVRSTASYPPVDTLIGGIINPENGGTAYLTVASAPGIKVKTLRQEADGNFSLVYSIPENGKILLKVRRVSGTTAATLWETTVADLGVASDEKLKTYPNTYVSGNDENALFILTRRDIPGTANTEFQLVRLNPDGQLGADTIDP